MKVDFKKQNVHTFEIFYESTGLTKANFLRPLAKLCVQEAGRTPKKITVYNFETLKPYFYIVKLGFTRVYIIFSYFCSKTYIVGTR